MKIIHSLLGESATFIKWWNSPHVPKLRLASLQNFVSMFPFVKKEHHTWLFTLLSVYGMTSSSNNFCKFYKAELKLFFPLKCSQAKYLYNSNFFFVTLVENSNKKWLFFNLSRNQLFISVLFFNFFLVPHRSNFQFLKILC